MMKGVEGAASALHPAWDNEFQELTS